MFKKGKKSMPKMDAEDMRDMKKGTYSAKEEASEKKKSKKKGGK